MSWLSRLVNVFRSDRVNRDLDDEILFHIEARARDMGLSIDEVRRRFGNQLVLRERSREAKVAGSLQDFLQDAASGLQLWRRRVVTAVAAILTLALGAGLNIAMTRVIWTVMLKPLPYPEPGRLVRVWVDDGKESRSLPEHSLVDRWREGNRTFQGLAAYRPWRMTVAGAGDPEQVSTALVSSDYFQILGARFVAGRAFTQEEAREGADNIVVLRESYWRSRFNENAAFLGQEISVDGILCRVVGIVADSFSAAVIDAKSDPLIYLPVSRARIAGVRVRSAAYVVGRLRDGVSITDARNDLATIAGTAEKRRIWLVPLQDEIGRPLRPSLIALFAATGCVLLIACANLANLLMGHALTRRRELAIRSALGAGKARILRQLMTEAAVLLTVGSVFAVALAHYVVRAMIALYPDGIPRATEDGMYWAVYTVAIAFTVAVGLAFAVVPAWRAATDSDESSLRITGSMWMGRGSRRSVNAMVAFQVGLTAAVLISTGVLFRTFLELRAVDIGVSREHVITASVDLPAARYKTREDRARFGAEWVQRMHASPGISAAGITTSLPLRYTMLFHILVHLPGSGNEQKVAGRAVGGAYFQAIGLPFVSGGPFDETRKGQAVVNEAFVTKYLPGVPPVGAMLGTEEHPMIVTGVVRNVRHTGLRDVSVPEIYLPFASFPFNPIDTVVRSSLPRADIEAELRRQLRAVDDQLAVGRVLSMDEVVDEQLARPRFQAVLLGLFAAVALTLAAVGTYGVIAQTVRSRLSEFALRSAIGAAPRQILRDVLAEGMKAPLAGLTVGCALGVVAAKRLLSTLLFGVAPGDPSLLVTTAMLLVGVSLLACLAPALLATRVQPARALRQE